MESIPLIASSIMSKKLASGSDCILLDVTVGTGAFMKTVPRAVELAQLMVEIGCRNGRKVAALITDMDTPLGSCIGNSLEVAESMEVLKGRGPEDLRQVCCQLAANMLMLAGKGSEAECLAMAKRVLADGSAFQLCKEMFRAQGGDVRVLDDPSCFAQAQYQHDVCSPCDGFICKTDAEKIGIASMLLGAGRLKKEDPIDYAAGIRMYKKQGTAVRRGERLATFYADDPARFAAAEETFLQGFSFSDEKPEPLKLIYARVTQNGVEYF